MIIDSSMMFLIWTIKKLTLTMWANISFFLFNRFICSKLNIKSRFDSLRSRILIEIAKQKWVDIIAFVCVRTIRLTRFSFLIITINETKKLSQFSIMIFFCQHEKQYFSISKYHCLKKYSFWDFSRCKYDAWT